MKLGLVVWWAFKSLLITVVGDSDHLYLNEEVSMTPSYCNYVSQFTVETYCFADGRCLFQQSQSVICHWNQYDEEISKKCRSVRLSVCNAKKKKSDSSIIDSRKIIRISGERVWHPLRENEAKFSKKYFSKILNFWKIMYLHKNACSSLIINSWIVIRVSYERAWHLLQENEAIFLKIYISIFDGIFEELRCCLLLLCY